MTALIVIFGAPAGLDGQPTGSLIRRVANAVEASADYPKCLFFASGGAVKNSTCEAKLINQLLLDHGIPQELIVMDEGSMSTIDTVFSCKSFLDSNREIGKVIICTSAYHVPRCSTLMSLAGIRHTNIVMPSELRDLGMTKYLKLVSREMLAMPLSLIRAFLRLL